MSKILLTNELGEGLGHLLPLRTLGRALVARGHHVTAALRDAGAEQQFLADSGINVVQVPQEALPPKRPHPNLGGFAHILANFGFADVPYLAGRVARWTHLLDDLQPHVVVVDHAPLALLATRGRPLPVVQVSTGFCCPPDACPLPFWTPSGHLSAKAHMADDERPLLENANTILTQHRRPPLERLAQLFNQVDTVILATYKELDCFGPRKEERCYWGHWHAEGGAQPAWPACHGRKVFAYLKPFAGLDALLEALKKADVATLVVARSLADDLRRRHAAPNMRFEKDPVNLASAASQCDLAITNAGHGTMASMLLAGKPMLLFPLYVEQLLNAQAVARLGAGKFLSSQAAADVTPALADMLSTDRYTIAAQAFASRYAGFTPGSQLPELAEHIESLAA